MSVSTCLSAPKFKTCLGVIPVRLRGPTGQTELTYALLDNGSDKTLCEESQAKRLGLRKNSIDFTLDTLGTQAQGEKFYGQEFDLNIEAVEGGGSVLARRVWTVKRPPISASLAAKQDDLKGFEHLAGVTLPSLTSGRVTLLIGMDSPDAHRAIETRRGKDGEPFAEKTELGWVVRGPLGQATCTRANVNFCKVQDQALSQELRRIWETDFIERKTMPSEVEKMSNASLSVEDKFALNQMENSLRVADNGHYEMDLAWKENAGALPESRFMAEKRLNSLKKKFEASQDFKQKYTDTMEGYIRGTRVSSKGGRNNRAIMVHPPSRCPSPSKTRQIEGRV